MHQPRKTSSLGVVFLGWCTLGAHGVAGADVVAGVYGTDGADVVAGVYGADGTDVVAGVYGADGTDVVAGVYGAASAAAHQPNRTACGPTRFYLPRAGHKRGGVA